MAAIHTVGTRADMQKLTLVVRISRTLNARIWIGSQLVKLAGWVIGSDVDVAIANEDRGIRRL